VPQPTSSLRSAFAIGGPLFNLGLVAVLMAISFLAVAVPDRAETDDLELAEGPPALAFLDETTTTTTAAPTTTTSAAPAALDTFDSEDLSAVNSLLQDLIEVAKDPERPIGEYAPPPEETVQIIYREVPAAPTATTPPRPECTDYDTRSAAQAAFASDPVGLAHFDGDGDGTACEHIPDPDALQILRCDDFEQQPDAQVVFDSDRDTYGFMDGDGDGRACEQLPGTPPELPATVEPPQVLSASAVRQQQGVFGFHTREAPWWMGELDYVTRLIGKAPNNLLFFSNWSTPFPATQVANTWERGMTPQVAWEPVIPGADSQPKLIEIINGEYDDYIDAWAADAAAHEQPIVLRMASEMNGDWYPWSERSYGNNVGEFAQMWRHVHGRFEAAGADNVIWLWSVNRVDNQPGEISNYWPGEEYVDWVGISGYWRGYGSAPEPTFAAVFDQTLSDLRDLTNKPILLAEIGAGTDVDTDRVTWLNTVFDGLAVNADVIGFVYFNEQKTGGDWRIQFSQGMVDAFAAGVAGDRWTSGVLPPGMEPGERLTVPSSE
jgi:hypothetical protein